MYMGVWPCLVGSATPTPFIGSATDALALFMQQQTTTTTTSNTTTTSTATTIAT